MINTYDSKNFRRIAGQSGDRNPIASGIQRPRALFTATGGETSLDLSTLSPQISYNPGKGQLDIKSSVGSFIAGVDFYETSATTVSFAVPLLPGEVLEITQTFLFTGNTVAQIMPNVYTVNNAATGLTGVTCDFSWPLNGLPSKRVGYAKVEVDGKTLQRNANNASSGGDADYYEVNLSQANTNQIVFTTPLIGGENVIVTNTFVAIDTTAASTLFNNTQISAMNTHGFRNYLINSNFDNWQRGTSGTVANGSSSYVSADRWYVENTLGTNGVLTLSQTAGVTPGSKYGASLKITTAPTAAQANGTELYQIVENLDTLDFIGKDASFGCYIKALGNVTQVGLSLVYNTSEAKTNNNLGSETLINVNTSTFTLGSVLAVAVGSTPTNAGVIGVRIRLATVSTGNTYDLNNGFVVEQAMLNIGDMLAPYAKAGKNAQEELAMCQRFYEKSYNITTAVSTNVSNGFVLIPAAAAVATATYIGGVVFKVQKRTSSPTVTTYSWTSSTATAISGANGTDLAANTGSVNTVSDSSFSVYNSSGGNATPNTGGFIFHWAASAEI